MWIKDDYEIIYFSLLIKKFMFFHKIRVNDWGVQMG